MQMEVERAKQMTLDFFKYFGMSQLNSVESNFSQLAEQVEPREHNSRTAYWSKQMNKNKDLLARTERKA